MVSEYRMSERHACALVGLSRDTYRYEGQTSALNMKLREQIVQTAHARRRWGYRRIHDVLRPQYPGINHKRVYRIYTAEGLSIRKGKKTKRIGVSDAERIHRELQWNLQGRVPGRELLRVAGAGPSDHCHMENRLQRDQTTQQLRAHTACDIRFESPVNWRFKA